jgi:hypothetical protein
MAHFDRKTFGELLSHEESLSVSLLLPTHRAGAEIRSDSIRLKNLVSQADAVLRDLGARPQDVAQRLGPARVLLEDEDFWQRRDLGLALYLDGDEPHILSAPLEFDEVCVVADRFHVLPLMPIAQSPAGFYVLALGQKSWRFFRASRHNITPQDLPDAPESLAAATRLDQPERHLEFHTGTPPVRAGGPRPAAFHGQGAAGDEANQKVLVRRYCRLVADAVYKALGEGQAPLVLAAAEPLGGLFHGTCRYVGLVDQTLEGNPEQRSPEELHAAALELVADRLDAPWRRARDRYHHLAARGQGTTDIGEILARAHLGQVETLFVATDAHLWGRFDVSERQATLHEEQEPGDEDLLNLAAVRTTLSGGTVYPLPREEMPDGALDAATLRFVPGGTPK